MSGLRVYLRKRDLKRKPKRKTEVHIKDICPRCRQTKLKIKKLYNHLN